MDPLLVQNSMQGISSLSMLSNTTLYLMAVGSSCGASFFLALGLILMKMANMKVEKMNGNARVYC